MPLEKVIVPVREIHGWRRTEQMRRALAALSVEGSVPVSIASAMEVVVNTREMIAAYPSSIDLDQDLLARAIEALVACSNTCTACADACLAEDRVADLRECIATDLDCADICATTARVVSRHTGYRADIVRTQLQACIVACKACGDECEQHAGHHEHCRLCAEACRACEQACADLLASIS